MDSKIILKKALSEAENKNYQIGNIDLTIITEEPKLSPHIKNIKNTLSQTLNLGTNRIGLKVTTNEKIGAIGRMEGIAAFAVCTLILKNIN
jgi:2-C-methyl-D-erythritol 2,4-cyclodiphosphate synthase